MSNLKKVFVTRDLTRKEIPWLTRDIRFGTTLYVVEDHFNVCTPEGIPVSEMRSGIPYFEIPRKYTKETFHNIYFGRN